MASWFGGLCTHLHVQERIAENIIAVQQSCMLKLLMYIFKYVIHTTKAFPSHNDSHVYNFIVYLHGERCTDFCNSFAEDANTFFNRYVI